MNGRDERGKTRGDDKDISLDEEAPDEADGLIRSFLLGQSGPVMEIELLRLTTGSTKMPADIESLFAVHFSLYHRLYRLRDRCPGHYLHLDPMRIRLLPVPSKGACGRYYPVQGEFCGASTGPGRALCAAHERIFPGSERMPSFDPLRTFYSDGDNISFGSFPLLSKIMSGVLSYAFRKREVDEAMSLLGIVTPDRSLIERRYRLLARKYHPDLHGGDGAMMRRVNDAYSLLKAIFFVPRGPNID